MKSLAVTWAAIANDEMSSRVCSSMAMPASASGNSGRREIPSKSNVCWPRAGGVSCEIGGDVSQAARARRNLRDREHVVASLPVEQGGGDLALVTGVERVGEPDHRVEQLAARAARQGGNTIANGGGDPVTADLGDPLVEHVAVVARFRPAAGVGVERRLDHVGVGAELVEGDERHREVAAEAALDGRGEGQLGVEQAIECWRRAGEGAVLIAVLMPATVRLQVHLKSRARWVGRGTCRVLRVFAIHRTGVR